MAKAALFVASSTTCGAAPERRASSHLVAHKHHLSPAFRPGKSNSGRGVDKSFPAARLKAKKASVITAQTVWLPTSCGPVTTPSRKKPVTGLTNRIATGCPAHCADNSHENFHHPYFLSPAIFFISGHYENRFYLMWVLDWAASSSAVRVSICCSNCCINALRVNPAGKAGK